MIKKLTFVLALTLFCISLHCQKQITLDDIWSNGEYFANSVPGFNFLQDGQHYTRYESGSINKYDILTGNFVESIFNSEEFEGQNGFPAGLNSYSFSSSENLIILKTNNEAIYRRSSKADFYIYNRTAKTITRVHPELKIGYATLSDDESKIAFTRENNLYLKDLVSNEIIQITTDGKDRHIINGSTDWVYEEEFGFAKAFYWSPDNNKIAFLRFDESMVKEYTIVKHTGDLYPEYQSFKYPKVGEKNATVSTHIYNLESKKTVKIDLPDSSEFYVPRIVWQPTTADLVVFKLNRHQNHLQLLIADHTGKTKVLLEEKNKYYVDIHDDLTFLANGKSFIWSSEKEGFNHLYLYNMKGELKRKLSSGDYDVTKFYGVDEERKVIYYQAAKKNPMERQIYRVGLNGKGESIVAGKSGTNRAQYSSTFDFYILNHSTINQASSYTVHGNQGTRIREIEENKEMNAKQQVADVQPIEFFDFKTSENITLNGWMLKPGNFNEKKKYPVFMTLYGGPGSQTVTDSWKGPNYWWYQMLAQQGYIVVSVDNRGTGARGEEFKKMTYLQLGKYETIDQIEAAKYLGSLAYIEGDRIGVFGWSYGGYMSTSCLLKGNDVFKAAIAVAPVTSWKWYDSVYTERYMRTEEENGKGYKDNSPVNFAEMLKGNYLLVHGNADDNVHFQHSAEMANALIRANKQFDTYFYPNRNHGIFGDNARLHLYTKMTNFLLMNL